MLCNVSMSPEAYADLTIPQKSGSRPYPGPELPAEPPGVDTGLGDQVPPPERGLSPRLWRPPDLSDGQTRGHERGEDTRGRVHLHIQEVR